MHKVLVLSTYPFANESAMIIDVGAECTHMLYRIASKKHNIRLRYEDIDQLTQGMDTWGRLEVVR
jgi:hypothetical protein